MSSKLVSPVVVTDGAKVLVVVIYDFSARCDIHSCTLVFFSLIFHFNLMRLWVECGVSTVSPTKARGASLDEKWIKVAEKKQRVQQQERANDLVNAVNKASLPLYIFSCLLSYIQILSCSHSSLRPWQRQENRRWKSSLFCSRSPRERVSEAQCEGAFRRFIGFDSSCGEESCRMQKFNLKKSQLWEWNEYSFDNMRFYVGEIFSCKWANLSYELSESCVILISNELHMSIDSR